MTHPVDVAQHEKWMTLILNLFAICSMSFNSSDDPRKDDSQAMIGTVLNKTKNWWNRDWAAGLPKASF